MNIVVISEENRILHITNYGYEARYIVYNHKVNTLIDGILESSVGTLDSYKVVEEIITLVQENIHFSSPYIYMYGDETDLIIKLINREKRKKDRTIVKYLNLLYDKSDFFTIYKDRLQYV